MRVALALALAASLGYLAAANPESPVVELTADNFDERVGDGKVTTAPPILAFLGIMISLPPSPQRPACIKLVLFTKCLQLLPCRFISSSSLLPGE